MRITRAILLTVTLTSALAAEDRIIGTGVHGLPLHRSEIELPVAMQSAAPQQLSQWCWAATISMAFRLSGHPVSQRRIVQETYGTIGDFPAANGAVIAQALNRRWVDDNGEPFSATLTSAYDADAGVAMAPNQALIQSLKDDVPVVVGTRQHAMLLTVIEWEETPAGPFVQRVGVFDPLPGMGFRGLTNAEFTPIRFGGALRFAGTFVLNNLPKRPHDKTIHLDESTPAKLDALDRVSNVLNDPKVSEFKLKRALDAFVEAVTSDQEDE